jgi:serine phosphatase RsbU (regulator of sigma subunit)
MMHKYLRYFSFILFFFFILSATHAQTEAPINQVDGEFIKEWLVLGPFFPDDLDKDFLADAGGETNCNPKEGDSFVTARGDTLRWKRCQTKKNIVDLRDVFGDYKNATAYAFCTLKSNVAGQHKILLGSEDGVAVWINGKRIHYNPSPRYLFLDHDSFGVDLKKGSNRCLIKISNGTGKWRFAMRAFHENKQILTSPKFVLSQDVLNEKTFLYNIKWKYHSGDNIEWARSDFDDSSWEDVYPELYKSQLPQNGWQGVGWFRFHIEADSAVINKPLGLSILQAGTSQLYLNGKLKHSFGEQKGDWTGSPKVITLEDKKSHILAVRYSNPDIQKFHNAKYPAGFHLQLGNIANEAEDRIIYERALISYQMVFTTMAISIGLLHLILFVFLPRLRQNLFFAFFLFSGAATIYFNYQSHLSTNTGQSLFFLQLENMAWPLFYTFKLRFIYSLFYKNLPKQFWLISLPAFCLSVFALFDPVKSIGLLEIIFWVVILEIGRVIITALINKKEGTVVIGLAFLVYLVFVTFDTLMDMGVDVPFQEMKNPYAFGILAFYFAMSVYLSRDFAQTNKKLVKEETERKLLEAENIRQSKELEQARQLQLSMLPKKLPQLPDLEIGVFMKTATEVGGDYYDFKQLNDGALAVVIGDATGHGLQAGTMVSATKSLFHALAEKLAPLQFLKESSAALKAMGLRNLFMALTIAKFKDNYMQVTAAGMPFPMIYRSANGQVEEVELKGMPLGGFTNFPYKDKKIQLNKGDTVLFLSDGLEEMFNPQNQLLGKEQVIKLFKETAANSPDEIIEYLKNEGVVWASGRDQEDDVTFVVIKIK